MSLIARLRSYRIGEFAIFDFLASYGAVELLAPLLKNYVSRQRLLWAVLPVAILTHQVSGTETPLTQMVLGPKANVLAQTIVGLCLIKSLAKMEQ